MASQSTIAQIKLREEDEIVSRSLLQLALWRLRRDKLTLIALSVVAVLAIASFSAPLIERALGITAVEINTSGRFLPMGTEGHILGTDDLGRDQFIRLLYGGQFSLMIAFLSAFLSLFIGVSLGIITGYMGGIVDDLVNWFITTLTSIPSLFLLLIVASILRPGPLALILILGLLGWTGTTRLVRGETLAIREREYVIGARAIGGSAWRIMWRHILPNLISIIVINLAIDIGALILTESALSFLGLGVKPPTPTWGNMLTEAQTFFRKGPHLIFPPGFLITITVLCLYVIGDGIRDAFDPTLEARK